MTAIKTAKFRLEIECDGDARVAHVRQALDAVLRGMGTVTYEVPSPTVVYPDKINSFAVHWALTKIKQG